MSFRFYLYLLIFISTSFLNTSFAEENDQLEFMSSLSPESLTSRSMVQLVRNEYRMAIHITERLLACFNNDEEWFRKNHSEDFRNNPSHCDSRIKTLTEKAKEKLPLMRIYLALSMKNKPREPMKLMGKDRSHHTDLYQFPIDPAKNTLLSYSIEMHARGNVLYPPIKHSFPTADIPPLNEEEVERGIEILNTDLSWIYHKYGGDLPSEKATCFHPEKKFSYLLTRYEHKLKKLSPERVILFLGDGISDGERNCYYDLYMALIFGNQVSDSPWIKDIEGFPLLAYFSSREVNDSSITEALQRRLDLTIKAKEDFESKYYKTIVSTKVIDTPSGNTTVKVFKKEPLPDLDLDYISELFIYSDLAHRLSTNNPELSDYVVQGKDIRDQKNLIRSLITIGAVLAAIPICTHLFIGPLARGLCMLPFGLGYNGYMIYGSETRLRNAVNDMLMSPNGLRILNHIDSIEDYEFSKNLEWLLLPVGTGLGDIGKGFVNFLKLK